jgi:hypothetical protein
VRGQGLGHGIRVDLPQTRRARNIGEEECHRPRPGPQPSDTPTPIGPDIRVAVDMHRSPGPPIARPSRAQLAADTNHLHSRAATIPDTACAPRANPKLSYLEGFLEGSSRRSSATRGASR